MQALLSTIIYAATTALFRRRCLVLFMLQVRYHLPPPHPLSVASCAFVLSLCVKHRRMSPPLEPQLTAAATRAALATYSRRLLMHAAAPPPLSIFFVRFLKACVGVLCHARSK